MIKLLALLTLMLSSANTSCDKERSLPETPPSRFERYTTDLTMYSRRGYEAHEMNTDELVWNARLSKQVWKKRLTLALEGFDKLRTAIRVTGVIHGIDPNKNVACA